MSTRKGGWGIESSPRWEMNIHVVLWSLLEVFVVAVVANMNTRCTHVCVSAPAHNLGTVFKKPCIGVDCDIHTKTKAQFTLRLLSPHPYAKNTIPRPVHRTSSNLCWNVPALLLALKTYVYVWTDFPRAASDYSHTTSYGCLNTALMYLKIDGKNMRDCKPVTSCPQSTKYGIPALTAQCVFPIFFSIELWIIHKS